MKPFEGEKPRDIETICRYAAEDTLDDADQVALSEQVRRLMGAEIRDWYVRIEGRDTLVPLSLFVVTSSALGEFSLAPRKREARIVRLSQIVGFEETRRPLPSRPRSWRTDALSAVHLVVWLPLGAFLDRPGPIVLEEEVRQYPPSYDPDYTLVDMLADFADQFTIAYTASAR